MGKQRQPEKSQSSPIPGRSTPEDLRLATPASCRTFRERDSFDNATQACNMNQCGLGGNPGNTPPRIFLISRSFSNSRSCSRPSWMPGLPKP